MTKQKMISKLLNASVKLDTVSQTLHDRDANELTKLAEELKEIAHALVDLEVK